MQMLEDIVDLHGLRDGDSLTIDQVFTYTILYDWHQSTLPDKILTEMAFIKFGDGGYVNATEANEHLQSLSDQHIIGRSTYDFYSEILLGTLELDETESEGCVTFDAV